MSYPRQNITVRLAPHEVDAIDKYAASENRTRSQMVRILIAEGVIKRYTVRG